MPISYSSSNFPDQDSQQMKDKFLWSVWIYRKGKCVCEHHDHINECVQHAECSGYDLPGNQTMCGSKHGRCSPYAG